uniref:V-SNARE coiled-coil homology domain-containing protein n=1 Tax=Corethron hystrix TaxID=216773 RepID=A0A6U5IQE0_9STRA|mmetsp:Transcript_34656/g.80134  ORF Transcript_34656/g.80134 Transcript_34656/m.80134 type:complete len:239 (+) Transcript_34656:119-835(+)
MPILLTFIARAPDGLPLVSSTPPSSTSGSTGLSPSDLEVFKRQAKSIMQSIDMSRRSGSPSKCSIESTGGYTFHYMQSAAEGVVYLALTEKSYPKRLVFLYLEEVSEAFVTDLLGEFGDKWQNEIQMSSRPYQFIKFDRVIQKKTREFVDPKSRQNTSKLNEDLADIQSIMKKNIQEVLNRGEKLEKMNDISSQLVSDSKKFKWGAKQLSYQVMLQQYGLVVVLGLSFCFVIYLKFFW